MQISEPLIEPLIEQLKSDNVLLLIGEGVDLGFMPQSSELAEQLTMQCAYPADEARTLARVAEFYEEYAGRTSLVSFLEKRLMNRQPAFPLLYHDLAQLPVKTIITTCYHNHFERYLDSRQIPYTPVARESQISSIRGDRRTLVWMWGRLEDPETLRITEDERRQVFSADQMFSRLLSEQIATKTWLCIGVDGADEGLREFYQQTVLKPDRLHRPPYFVGSMTELALRRWKKNSANILTHDIQQFLQALVERLAAPAQTTMTDSSVASKSANLAEQPYLELEAFDRRSMDKFFGRDDDIKRIIGRIQINRLLVLYGASGVGKTSLLQAGIIPFLERADPPYTVISIRGFRDPQQAIRAEVHKALATQGLSIEDHVSLPAFLATAVELLPSWLLIVFDQFEEFFISVPEKLRDDFLLDLQAINSDQAMSVKMVFSLREDWLPHMDKIEECIPRLAKLRLKPLTRAQAYEAIVAPVKRLNMDYQPELVNQLLADLSGAGLSDQSEFMPPQLQIVCTRLFEARGTQMRLMLALYEWLGGAKRILNEYLDDAIRSFAAERQQLARHVLEELVTAYGTKAVKDRAELARDTETQPETLMPVLKGMIERRLLRTVEIGPGHFGYELAHEYLIQRHDLDDPVTRRRREQEKLLKQEVETWRLYGYLLGSNRLEALFAVHTELHLSPAMQKLLLCSALETDQRVEEWAACVTEPARRVAILKEVAYGRRPVGQASVDQPNEQGEADGAGDKTNQYA